MKERKNKTDRSSMIDYLGSILDSLPARDYVSTSSLLVTFTCF